MCCATWIAANFELRRANALKRKFGIDLIQYESMFKKQNGSCAICGNKNFGDKRNRYLCIDHDHVTLKIRGLLCSSCNKGLGQFKDNKNTLIKAAIYLQKYV